MGTRANTHTETYFLRLLEFSPFERRTRGGWRFGTRRISDCVADRLIDSDRAEIVGNRLLLKREARP
ncbi:hypothetical protein AB7M63_003644 [Bradyrhizobium japonicum]